MPRGAPRRRWALSLRWKVFGALVLILSGVQIFLGVAEDRERRHLDGPQALAQPAHGRLTRVAGAALQLSVSILAVFALIAPAMGKLRRISSSLPLIADHRFAEARKVIGRHRPALFADEVDQLRDSAAQLADRLERLTGAEAESAAKSSFLATVSHEVRTPLNGIIAMAEMLAMAELAADHRQQAALIRDSGLALLRVIDDILEFSKIEANKLTLQPEPASLRTIVESVTDTLAISARSRGLRLLCFVDPLLPPRAMVDPLRLRQVLLNLAGNALKFTAEGRIAVCAELGGGAQLRCRVTDTGIGIAPHIQSTLFSRFTQAEASTTRRFGGTGLGLSICRGLVEQMGGKIGLSSAPGKGSEFWFEIPLQPAPADPTDVDYREVLRGVAARIALADADETAFIAQYLRSAGATVLTGTAISPGTAIQVLDSPNRASLELARSSTGASSEMFRPIGLRALIETAARLSGHEARLPAVADGQGSGAAPIATPAAPGQVILVAEDNAVNQTIIRMQLEKLGHSADIAADGAQALRLFRSKAYALVITDLHMPEMDGYEVAREIRRGEPEGRRVPIVALTANATRGEAERCRAAGMDDYVTKPLTLARLAEKLREWLPYATALASAGPAPAPSASPIDLEALGESLGLDPQALRGVLTDFVELNGETLAQLRSATAAGDVSGVARLCHKSRGSAAVIGAAELVARLQALESAAAAKPRDALDALQASVDEEFRRLVAFISTLRS